MSPSFHSLAYKNCADCFHDVSSCCGARFEERATSGAAADIGFGVSSKAPFSLLPEGLEPALQIYATPRDLQHRSGMPVHPTMSELQLGLTLCVLQDGETSPVVELRDDG